jgi:hypothetical protein
MKQDQHIDQLFSDIRGAGVDMSYGTVEGMVTGTGGASPWYLGNQFQTVILIVAVSATTLFMLYPGADDAAFAATISEPEPQELQVPVFADESTAPVEEQSQTLKIETTPDEDSHIPKPSHTEEDISSDKALSSPDVSVEVEEDVAPEQPDIPIDEEVEEVVDTPEEETTPVKTVEKPVYTSRNQVLEDALVSELLANGLVDDTNNFKLRLTSRSLKINGEKLSKDAHKSLRTLFESTSEKNLAAGSYVILEKINGQSKLDMKITDFE